MSEDQMGRERWVIYRKRDERRDDYTVHANQNADVFSALFLFMIDVIK